MIELLVTLHCDGVVDTRRCPSQLTGASQVLVLEEAERRGWLFTDDGLDLCPGCKGLRSDA